MESDVRGQEGTVSDGRGQRLLTPFIGLLNADIGRRLEVVHSHVDICSLKDGNHFTN